MKYYKVLDKDGCSCYGGNIKWSLPKRREDGTWTPGEWMPPVEGDLEPCLNGYHVVTLEQLRDWPGWPAGMEQEQRPYEPPRTTKIRKNRAKRLRCLGNAVVPQQAYPIFRAIMEVECNG